MPNQREFAGVIPELMPEASVRAPSGAVES
jgi:hypothetical protein